MQDLTRVCFIAQSILKCKILSIFESTKTNRKNCLCNPRCVKFPRFPDVSTRINCSDETSHLGIRDEKGYLYRRIPARAGVSQSRERREKKERGLFGVFLPVLRGRGRHSLSLSFFLPHILHSSAILLLANAIRYAPTSRSCPTNFSSISLHYLIAAPADLAGILSLRSTIENSP